MKHYLYSHISLGLDLVAMYVRSMTLHFVDKGTLQEYKYLEHGAHFAIGALSTIMLLKIFIDVPEVITGLVGVGFISAAFTHSVIEKRKDDAISARKHAGKIYNFHKNHGK